MARHNTLGSDGEAAAMAYLERLGFTILHHNWRFGHEEIDIVAKEGDTLVFAEVKTRRTLVDDPRDVLSETKMRHLVSAAEAYINTYDRHEEARFDLLILTPRRDGDFDTRHIREAFR